MVASKLHLPIFVPPPVLRLHEFRATSTFLFWCWGPELGFSYLHSQLPYLGRHLSSISFSFLFCLLQEGPRTSPLLGRHCTTEPHSQNSPLLKHFQMSVTVNDFCQVTTPISEFVPGMVNHPRNPSTVCVYHDG